MIVLKIVGPYGENGWEDPDTGVRYYNSVTMSPYGPVGNLKTHVEYTGAGCDCEDPDYRYDWETGEERLNHDHDVLVIDQAPDYVLIGRGFIESQGYTDAFGATWVDIIGRNGRVRYQVLDEDVVWDDDRDKVLSIRLCFRAFEDWEPETEYVEEPRRESIEVPVTEENLNA